MFPTSKEMGITFYIHGSDHVWVSWDNGQVLYVGIDEIEKYPNDSHMTEDAAVKLLLSLGYTISRSC